MFFGVFCKDHVLYIKHIFLYAVILKLVIIQNCGQTGQLMGSTAYLFFFQKMPCPVDRCDISTTNVGQHLIKFHGFQRGTISYARLMKHSQKARTMYSKSKFTVYDFQQQQNTKSLNKWYNMHSMSTSWNLHYRSALLTGMSLWVSLLQCSRVSSCKSPSRTWPCRWKL